MSGIIVRPSQKSDLAAITAIYAHHVLHGTGTFEMVPPNKAEMHARRAEVLGRNLPFLVVESQGTVQGYAYCNWFKPRPAYRYSAEDSIYIAEAARGKGLGRILMDALCRHAHSAGIFRLIAVIGDADNLASIALHKAAGFAHAGQLRSVGWKANRWLDIVLMEKTLRSTDRPPRQADTAP